MNDQIKQAFEIFADEKGFCLDCEFFSKEPNNYEDPDTRLAFDIFASAWQAAGSVNAELVAAAQFFREMAFGEPEEEGCGEFERHEAVIDNALEVKP